MALLLCSQMSLVYVGTQRVADTASSACSGTRRARTKASWIEALAAPHAWFIGRCPPSPSETFFRILAVPFPTHPLTFSSFL